MSGQYVAIHSNYPRSTAYRILAVLAVARLIERKSLYVDLTVASPSDFEFITALRLTIRVWTAPELFESLKFDDNRPDDYLFGSIVRGMVDNFSDDDGNILTPEKFAEATQREHHDYLPLFRFLDDLRFGEGRLRADRFLSAHLVLLAALDAFGYRYQRMKHAELVEVALRCEHRVILRNLTLMIEKLQLDHNASFRTLVRTIREIRADTPV